MQKKNETPGSVLNALLKKHGLNYSSLAKAIGLSGAMVRLIALDENPVSAPVAFRLAVFFKMSPVYWLTLQSAFDLNKTAKDKKLAKALKAITTVDKVEKQERKPRAKKSAKKGRPAKAAKKPAGKRGRPAKAAKKPAGKRGRPAAKKTGAKRGRPAARVKQVVRAKPAVKAKPVVKARVVKVKNTPSAPESRSVTPPPAPVNHPEGTVNEPII